MVLSESGLGKSALISTPFLTDPSIVPGASDGRGHLLTEMPSTTRAALIVISYPAQLERSLHDERALVRWHVTDNRVLMGRSPWLLHL